MGQTFLVPSLGASALLSPGLGADTATELKVPQTEATCQYAL